jgi:hypothetical protein
VWTQPEDNQIFASFRNDVPASSTLFPPATAGTTGTAGTAGAKTSVAAGLAADGQQRQSPSGTPSTTTSTKPASPSHVTIPARTGNQSICAG